MLANQDVVSPQSSLVTLPRSERERGSKARMSIDGGNTHVMFRIVKELAGRLISLIDQAIRHSAFRAWKGDQRIMVFDMTLRSVYSRTKNPLPSPNRIAVLITLHANLPPNISSPQQVQRVHPL